MASNQRARRARSNASPEWLSWRGFLYYGEVFGFVAAWVVGVVAIVGSKPTPGPTPPADRVAAVTPPAR